MVRRLFVIAFGLALAASLGAVFLAIGALFDPTTRALGLQATTAMRAPRRSAALTRWRRTAAATF